MCVFGVRSPNSGSMACVLLYSDGERRTRTWGIVAIVSVAQPHLPALVLALLSNTTVREGTCVMSETCLCDTSTSQNSNPHKRKYRERCCLCHPVSSCGVILLVATPSCVRAVRAAHAGRWAQQLKVLGTRPKCADVVVVSLLVAAR